MRGRWFNRLRKKSSYRKGEKNLREDNVPEENENTDKELWEKLDMLFDEEDVKKEVDTEEHGAEDLSEVRNEDSFKDAAEKISLETQDSRNKIQLPDDIQKIVNEGDFSDDQIKFIQKIPWHRIDVPEIDIEKAKEILETTHYGMFDVKERILRYIACQKHLGKTYGVILLLVGPPGVGKTSIAKSIAKALNREFIKISLAGMADADPLKGYDRNYKQAKPGEIINAIIKANSFCPLILLDEIDKMASSQQRGDPAHVLLDILDSDRTNFMDNMIEIAVDLSNVIFVATANDRTKISPILLDRLEIIKLKGYTKSEKMYIAKHYLVPSLLSEYQIVHYEVNFKDELVEYIIDNYTNEPGIRSLERHLKTICETIISYNYLTKEIPKEIGINEFKKIVNTSYFDNKSNALEEQQRKVRKKGKKQKVVYNIEL